MSSGRPRVLILTVGDGSSPGTRLRSLAYLPYLRDHELDVDVRFPLASGRFGWPRRLLRSIELARDLALASRYDVIVVYRKTFPGLSATLLRRRARRLVFEYDDAVYLPAPSEPQDERSRERYRRNFDSTVAIADHVVAGNRRLAEAAGDCPVTLVPTAVDTAIFRPCEKPAPGQGCVIGWIGTAENLEQWLSLLGVFRRVLQAVPSVRFKIVSDRQPPEIDLPLEFERFTIERQAAALGDFDIGLMPLEDTAWNRGKCAAKALQCMAMAMPVVVSPVGMNREVVNDGVSGFLAGTEDEWVGALTRLAESAELRKRLGRSARAVVEESYSLDRIGAVMADLLTRLAR